MVSVEGRNVQFWVRGVLGPSLARQLLCFVCSSRLTHQLAVLRSQMEVMVGFSRNEWRDRLKVKDQGNLC